MKWPWYHIFPFKHLSLEKICYFALIMHHNVVGGIFLWSSTLRDFKIIIHVSFHKPKSGNSIRVNKFIYILLQFILCGHHKRPISWKIHLGSNSNNYVVIKEFIIQLIVVHSYINIRPTTWSLNFVPTNIYKNGLTFIALYIYSENFKNSNWFKHCYWNASCKENYTHWKPIVSHTIKIRKFPCDKNFT